jgi:hypothetical protein
MVRTATAVTMFDRPGGKPEISQFAFREFDADPDATAVVFTAHADTYLVQERQPVYHVAWTASTTFTRPPAALAGQVIRTGEVSFALGPAGAVTGLPNNLRAVLHSSYPDFKDVQ